MDTRTIWFVVETEEERSKLAATYGDRILLCDRSFILDTNKGNSLDNTTELHEVRSSATTIPAEHPRVWPATVSNLPCNCTRCIQNPMDTNCTYAKWCKPRPIEIQVGCVEDNVAEEWVSKNICRRIKQKLMFGTATKYLPDKKKWLIKFTQPFKTTVKKKTVETDELELDYVDLWKGIDMHEAMKHHEHDT